MDDTPSPTSVTDSQQKGPTGDQKQSDLRKGFTSKKTKSKLQHLALIPSGERDVSTKMVKEKDLPIESVAEGLNFFGISELQGSCA